MWFDDEELSGRRLRASKSKRPRAILRVSARQSTQKRARMYRLAVFVLLPVALAIACGLAWWGTRLVGSYLFSKNDLFVIKHLNITAGEIITEPLVREYTGLHEGMNLFAPDIRAIRRRFLAHTPVVKAMNIRRVFPDTLQIEVTERQAIARLGRRGYLVVDDEGSVFAHRGGGGRQPPEISGHSRPSLKPGQRLDGLPRDAVRVLAACQEHGIDRELVFSEINAAGGFSGREDALRFYLEGGVTVDFWWPRGRGQRESADDEMLERLRYLRAVLRRAAQEGQRLQTVNLTLDDYTENCPVTPVWH